MKWHVGKSEPGTQECNQAEITRPFQTSLHSKSSNHESARPSEKWSHVLDEEAHLSERPVDTFPVQSVHFLYVA